ncbi:MAG: low affinity iron permease family protein [Alphaproteobacteria bacterium]|nr:low affinity iron permease family protein [Alphaproteobacteria bacterium]
MQNNHNGKFLENLAYHCAKWTGTSWAFLIALGLTIVWFISGPLFSFGDSWQLVMNTVSSIVTFLMVFLLQRSQNKDSLAMQLKLNEIIATLQGANNKLISIENLSESEIMEMHDRYQALAAKLNAGGHTSTMTVSAHDEPHLIDQTAKTGKV